MNKLLLSVAALAVAIPAMAQVQAPQAQIAPVAKAPRMNMPQTRDQAVAKVREHFAKMDTNRDGFIAGDEMQAMRAQHQGMRGERGNRQAMRDPKAAFDRLDANRDGAISRDEFAKGHEMRKERRIAMHGQPGAPGAMQHDGHRGMMKGHRMGGMMRGHMMKMADLDKDGRVSLQEATTKALEHFDRVDSNRDGRITPEERQLNREQRKQMRAPKAG